MKKKVDIWGRRQAGDIWKRTVKSQTNVRRPSVLQPSQASKFRGHLKVQIKLSFWWFEGPPTRNRGPEGPKTSSCWIFYVESAKCNAKCQNKTDFFSANILGKLPAISLKDNLRRWRTFSNCNFWTPQKVKWNICVSTQGRHPNINSGIARITQSGTIR